MRLACSHHLARQVFNLVLSVLHYGPRGWRNRNPAPGVKGVSRTRKIKVDMGANTGAYRPYGWRYLCHQKIVHSFWLGIWVKFWVV